MASEHIKVRVGLRDSIPVINIAEWLDLDEYSVVGKLLHLWGWAQRYAKAGHVEGISFAWVDRFVGTPGFAESMEGAGWLQRHESGILFTDDETTWEEGGS